MNNSTQHLPCEADAACAWVITLLTGPEGRPRVLHPEGVSPLPDATDQVTLCGTHRIDGTVVTWAFGYVRADSRSPIVWFLSKHGLRAQPGAVRRLTTTTWAAQLLGRWARIRVA